MKKWSNYEIKFLKENCPSNPSIWDISRELDRSIKSLHRKAQRMGLKRKKFTKRPKPRQPQKIINKRHYDKNREEFLRKKSHRVRKFRKEIKFLAGGKCSKCGYNRSLHALDFHHIKGDKGSNLSKMIKSPSKQKALKEIKKCILLCANCHREVHFG
tara:strand:- start:651 stop:1121 length:471 start_codon:yes stop_codon:yes gene_type:complete